jgi:hypothetical protein
MSVRPAVIALAFFALASVACTRVKVQEVRGADGHDWKAISCSRMNEKCFKTAQRMCPNGYVFAREGESSAGERQSVTTLPPQEEWRDEMYSKKPGKLLVRCASSASRI